MPLASLSHGKHCLLATAIAAVLAGCNDGENSTNASSNGGLGDSHQELSFSRFAVSEFGSNSVYVLNAHDFAPATAAPMSATSTISGLKTSPDGRYALVLQRNDGHVEIIDSGVEAEVHGDHFHLHSEEPSLVNERYLGVKPTHYDPSTGVSSLFFDGNENENAKFHILSDASIATGGVVASYEFGYAVHGLAQVLGEQVFTGVIDEVLDAGATLPNRIRHLHLHHDHFHFEQDFALECHQLHGGAQSQSQIAFGCSDGVALVNVDGENVTAQKLNNPTFNPAQVYSQYAQANVDVRIGKLVGFKQADKLLAIANNLQSFLVQGTNLVEVNWKQSEEETAITYHNTDDAFVVLASSGYLNIFSAADDFALKHSIKVFEEFPALEAGQSFSISKDLRSGHLIVTNPAHNTLIEVDLDTNAVKTHQLDFKPHFVTWVGTTEEEYQH